jgi:hypothetical protein
VHVFRVAVFWNALVLADAAVASMGASPSSRISGAVATQGLLYPNRRLEH